MIRAINRLACWLLHGRHKRVRYMRANNNGVQTFYRCALCGRTWEE